MLITEAHAQAAEAAKAAADAGAVLLDKGVLGAVCVLLSLSTAGALWLLLKAHDKHTALLERVITIAESSKAGLTAAATAVDGMGDSIGKLTQGVQALSHEVENDERETRHGLAGLATGQQGIAGRLEKISERLFERERP